MAQDPQTNAGIPSEVKDRPSRAAGSAPSRAPEPFGKYILLQRIGAGGMAEVFQAIVSGPEGFQRSLVVKRMLPQLSQDEAFVRMFIDEAKLSGLLSHPNLVQIVEFGKVDECFFIAMEYVHGRTLAAVKSKLHASERLAPIAASAEIARQLCVGLDYAHGMQSPDGKPLGIVHRDISPPNVMLDFHGVVKILDFGIARVAEGLRDSRTQVGMMKGKIAYMSPEQLQLGDIDRRSDVFAVGIVLHEMLTGRRLFRSNTDYASSRMVLEMEIVEPSALNAAVPAELDRIVMRALQRDRDARYATAGEMAADLERVMSELRYSPREHLALLRDLFPDAEANEKGLTVTGNFSVADQQAMAQEMAEQDKPTSYASHVDLPRSSITTAPSLSERSGLAGDPGAQGGGGRRTRLIAIAAGVALGLVVLPLALRFRGGGERAAKQGVPAAPVPAAPAVPAPPAQVHLSLDSTPQDATVIQVETGKVLGHTPFTIALGRAQGAKNFRFEKTDYAPLLYKIIPDLDKSVRVELVPIAAPVPAAAPAATPQVAGAPQPARPAPTARRERGKGGRRAAAAAAAPRTEGGAKDCLVTIGSFPWAELWIDGKDVGQPTPVVRLPITCGPHKLRFKRDNPEIDQVESITVTAGQELKKNFRLAGADVDG